MCTAISYKPGDHYFGRNLDLEFHYNTSVVICPRNYPLAYRHASTMEFHYAIIGIAYIQDNYPLYYDAANEYGLSMGALNFPENAVYLNKKEQIDNIAPFELIPWILGQCRTVAEARLLLSRINLIRESFSQQLPLSPLHWILSDQDGSLVIEPTEDGVKVYDNPIGVLTNNPPFPFHRENLSNYLNLTAQEPTNRFAKDLNLRAYSRGMGAIGLPGDLSSASRFVKAAFTLHNCVCEKGELYCVSQFFHILDSVLQSNGCNKVGDQFEKTIYSSCYNTQKSIFYYKTYNNSRITAIHMHHYPLDGQSLCAIPMRYDPDVLIEDPKGILR